MSESENSQQPKPLARGGKNVEGAARGEGLGSEAERERMELRELCQQMLVFENEFLQLCQEPDAD
jgi:hypothetical protein